MRRLLFLIFFCLCVLTLPVCFKRLTCGFKLIKMQLNIPFRQEWAVDHDINVQEILSQRFKYLNRGAQSYVFKSLDDKYVVKFFRFDRMHKNQDKKINALFTACLLAFTKAKEETGILYVHLNQTQDQLPIMHLTGPLGQKISLNPDEYRFVIQKKAISFQEAMTHAEPEIVRKRLDSFIALLQSRIRKGIRNTDHAVVRNFGFIGDKAVEIDFGNYSEKPTSNEDEFSQKTTTLHAWLRNNAAEWVEYFDNRIANNR
ncbi:MAG TPA: hypothetical protein VLE96_07310 [Chlamydiales bacterium]|nr:hypothetical protein [Chlamydiales bacterium]